jgi:uncharacterized protein HemX
MTDAAETNPQRPNDGRTTRGHRGNTMSKVTGWVIALVLILGGAGLTWYATRERAEQRCERIAAEQVVHDAIANLAEMDPSDTSVHVPKPPSKKEREWYAENCFNGKPMR